MRHTIAKRMRAKLVEIKEALNRMRHVPVPEQGRWLGQVVRGYLAYHAVPTNSPEDHVLLLSRRVALATRALAPKPEQPRHVAAHGAVIAVWLPPARISHPLPDSFLVKHPRWEPSAVVAPAGICAGGGEQSPSLVRCQVSGRVIVSAE